MVADETQGPSRHTGALFLGFPDVSVVVCEERSEVFVAESADGEAWVGYGFE